ncbi:hypothetical protein C7M84_024310 [Penaeus vannamei]|uniref:Chitin-binding type-2 domain-containing protein n=1 Tax=Penaeus vannamei TaxID=6689 RepID=A0A423U1C9_PENVA|nr:hypothetical protein C7M84_024310 [Penaeus vannamei]
MALWIPSELWPMPLAAEASQSLSNCLDPSVSRKAKSSYIKAGLQAQSSVRFHVSLLSSPSVPLTNGNGVTVYANGVVDPFRALADAIGGGGVPGVDYPILAFVPATGFSCNGQLPGYYADTAPEAGCQVFHICQAGGRIDSFLCPNGTVFNQQYFVCDWWYNFDCSTAEQFYGLNAEIGYQNGNGVTVYANGVVDPFRALADAIGGGGVPGVDYPILAFVPATGFSCNGQLPGYYADTAPEAGCQVFHICQAGGRIDSFLCPNGTVFNQQYFVCDWWYNFDCSTAEQFYGLNAEIGYQNGNGVTVYANGVVDPFRALADAIGGGGVPGVDYPILAFVPATGFSCNGQLPGYYADTAPEAGCQVFHICQAGGRIDSFLCPNGTVFNQQYFVCDWWYNFDCSTAEQFYGLNAEIGNINGNGYSNGNGNGNGYTNGNGNGNEMDIRGNGYTNGNGNGNGYGYTTVMVTATVDMEMDTPTATVMVEMDTPTANGNGNGWVMVMDIPTATV